MTNLRMLFVVGMAASVCGPVSADDAGQRLGGATFKGAWFVALQAEIDSLKAKTDSLTVKNENLLSTTETLRDKNAELLKQAYTLKEKNAELLKKSDTLTEKNTDLLKKSEALAVKNEELETKNKSLEKARDEALALRLDAEKDAKAARLQLELVTKKYENLLARVEELKLSLTKDKPNTPPPPREGLRGTVEAYENGLVVLSIGADSGLTRGTELELTRTKGTKYLGTVMVTDVYPKAAVGRFKPAGNAAIGKLPADDLPKVGDTVGTKPKE